MVRKLLKTIVSYPKNDSYWQNMPDKNMTFIHKAIIALRL